MDAAPTGSCWTQQLSIGDIVLQFEWPAQMNSSNQQGYPLSLLFVLIVRRVHCELRLNPLRVHQPLHVRVAAGLLQIAQNLGTLAGIRTVTQPGVVQSAAVSARPNGSLLDGVLHSAAGALAA